MSRRREILRLSDFDCMPVRVIKPKDALPPCLSLNSMYQFYLRPDLLERCINILMLKI